MPVTSTPFGKTHNGAEITCYEITNGTMTVKVINFGGCIISLQAPDKNGSVDDVTLGYDNLAQWEDNPTYFAAAIGRVGNRVSGAKFWLEGTEYKLAANNGEASLHGGPEGFHKRVWDAVAINSDNKVVMTYVSPDGEEGYPGKLTATVSYQLTDANEVSLEYTATTDKTTIVNLTNHSYFNLAGAASGDVMNHEILAPIRAYTPVDAAGIPDGTIASVKKTPFDFSIQTAIGARNAEASGGFYDHNLVVNRAGINDGDLALVCTVSEPTSGRVMKVTTTEPGCQLYVGGFLDGSNVGREGKGYVKFGGFCLETQKHPDSINQENFPSIILKPGETMTSKTVYAFSTQNKKAK